MIAIGGEPATGKTTLMRSVMSALGRDGWYTRRYRKLLWTMRRDAPPVIVFGIYNGGKFDGTDRLSMAVQPEAIELLSLSRHAPNPPVILFEGDRLFTGSFLDSARKIGVDVRGLVLTVPEATLSRRHRDRGDTQGEAFLAGRRTKYARLLERPDVEAVKHEAVADTDELTARIVGMIGGAQ